MMSDQPRNASGRGYADPCIFVIFGASGDLTKRLLVPSLYHLAADGLLPNSFAVIGVSRSDLSHDEFRRRMREGIEAFAGVTPAAVTASWLLDRLFYLSGDFDDHATYERLRELMAQLDAKFETRRNGLFYLATPPTAFIPVTRHLGRARLAQQDGNWRRIIVEKPFGADLASAQTLNKAILAVFAEPQIYRIDHYLGKETVQNIIALRFANGIFESLWNRDRIDHVQITVAETLSVEGRGKFYDSTGALRDMVPNHLFQLLALVGMEPPGRFDAQSVRAEKTKLLRAVQQFSPDTAMREAVRGQYGGGTIGGTRIVPYRQAHDVAPGSVTETFVALRLMIDNWRWAGVPFYLRTGKALAARRSEIAIKFKEAPYTLF